MTVTREDLHRDVCVCVHNVSILKRDYDNGCVFVRMGEDQHTCYCRKDMCMRCDTVIFNFSFILMFDLSCSACERCDIDERCMGVLFSSRALIDVR